MNRYWALAALAALALGAAAVRAEDAPAAKAEEGPAASTQEQIEKMDQGTDVIDVSKYPKEQQDNYKVFSEKCSKCHTLARPINSPYALPQEWQAYVTKMRSKKRSGIDEDSAKQIISFLTYDSSVRKKDAIAARTKDKGASAQDAPAAAPKAQK